VGTTTVIVYTTPFWIKARLDEKLGFKRRDTNVYRVVL
jgi:hypothetical protein